jgi:hypothetical protein
MTTISETIEHVTELLRAADEAQRVAEHSQDQKGRDVSVRIRDELLHRAAVALGVVQ